MQAHTERRRSPWNPDLGVTGRIVVGGTVSTGLLLGGYVVAAMTLAGRMNANGLLLTSLGLFIIGAALGLLLSGAVGVVGREAGVDRSRALARAARGALFAVPACLVGAILAGWVAMAIMTLYVGDVAPVAFSILGALVGAVVMVATFEVTCDCCGNLARRLRDGRGRR